MVHRRACYLLYVKNVSSAGLRPATSARGADLDDFTRAQLSAALGLQRLGLAIQVDELVDALPPGLAAAGALWRMHTALGQQAELRVHKRAHTAHHTVATPVRAIAAGMLAQRVLFHAQGVGVLESLD